MSLLIKIREDVSREWPAYLVIGLGLVIQLLLISQPLDFLITDLLPDDAFYYFEIARHILAGDGPTFDGVHSTNGYHPLWLIVLLPVFAFFSTGGVHDLTPIYASLVLSASLFAVSGIVVLHILRRISKEPWVLALALALWSLNPFLLYESINGLETALMLLLAVSFALAALRAEEGGDRKAFVLAGIIAGFMILARLDTAIYLAAFCIWMLVRYGLRTGIRLAFLTGITATIVALPWMLWNLVSFDMLMTSASAANPFVNHTLTVLDNGTGIMVTMKSVIYMLIYFGRDLLTHTGAPWLVFGVAGGLLALVASGRLAVRLFSAKASVLIALAFGFAALFLANAGVRFTGRSWYFVFSNFFIVLGACLLLSVLFRRNARMIAGTAAIAVAVLGTYAHGWYTTLHEQFLNQRGMYEMALWMNEHLPADTPVGIFNAGTAGYFSHARVVNLDGLVNNSAYEALRKKELWTYLHDERIEYLSDFDLHLSYRYRPFFDTEDLYASLEEVTRIEYQTDARGLNSLPLYRVRTSE